MSVKKFRAMVVSVGGTPSPIIFSLNKARPEYICFFISPQTKKMMEEEIIPKLEFKPKHYDWIVTPNSDLLSDCYGKLLKDLPKLLEKWEIKPEDVCVDYTGGTKTMSAALVLATVEGSCYYSYVGGDERSKGGIGVVLDGKERMHFLANPWDQIAAAERKEAAILFNKARYASASEIIERCISRVSREHRPLLKAIKELVDGYDSWDRFKHVEARRNICRSLEVLTAISTGRNEFKGLIDRIEENIQFLLQLLEGQKPSKLYFYDLLSNARRRADLEHKYDDAVARLYRAVEMIAQIELKARGINTSNVREDDIPEPLRQDYIARYRNMDDGKIRLPLYASFALLERLGSEIASGFFRLYEKRLRSLLDIRNNSILAHGFNPVKQSTFEDLWSAILEFSQIDQANIPKFPQLKF